MRIFLTLKHWQLFVLLVGIPMVLPFIIIGSFIFARDPTILFISFPTLMILDMVVFFGWFYSLGTNLFKRLPVTVKMSLTTFKIFLFIPVVFMVFLLVFMFGMVSTTLSGEQPNLLIFALIIPLDLFCMFCLFYCMYFIAKALKAVELQKTVTFNDYVGEFFLLWFYPVGIWFLQPRINKLITTTSDNFGDSFN